VTLPRDIAELLWSYDASKVDPGKDARIVIMSVARLGSWDQIEWLFSHYGWDEVKRVIGEDYFGPRSLPVSVRAFWGNLFWPELPPPELADKMERWRQTRTIERQAATGVRQRLEDALRCSGLSQSAFASLLGTSQPRLSSYLSGKVTPSATFLLRAELVAKALSARTGPSI